jgi:hypothetical protein
MALEDIRDFLTALSAAGVRHIVVGAHALAVQGHLRATGDFDVLIEATPANARRLAVAIKEFAGVSLEYFQVSVATLSRPGVGFFMGAEPHRIDVLTRIAGLGFERAWRDRVPTTIAGVESHVLGLASLIAAKRASAPRRVPGSLKAGLDQTDLIWLLAERERRRRKGKQR